MRTTQVALVILVLFAAGPRAAACLNDREVNTYEREFRSHYMDKDYQPLSPGELDISPADAGHPMAMTLLGVAFLASATLLGATRPRRLTARHYLAAAMALPAQAVEPGGNDASPPF
jgi:hypothetical protein